MSLRSVNLNLVPVLQALLRERNLSRAARELHLTQPAVSAALARLRVAFKDPLLVQVGRSMQLTPRALALIDPVEQACAALARLVAPATFEPLKLHRRFVISTFDYSPVVLAPPLIEALAEQAPGVSMHFVDQSADAVEKHRLREVDLMFAPRALLGALVPSEVRTLHVLRDQFVYMVGPGHALYEARRPSAAQLAAQSLVRFQPALTPALLRADWLTHGGVGLPPLGRDAAGRHEVVLVEQFSVLPLIALLSGSCMALAPRRLIEPLQAHVPLRIFDAGLAPIDLCIAWNALHDADPEHRWFRELLRDEVGDDRHASTAAARARRAPRKQAA